MRQLCFLTVMILGFGVNGAPAQEVTDGQTTDTISPTHYICERNVHVPVVYINTAGGNSYAVIHIEGKQVALQQQTSASGAYYIALDEEDSYRWYTKGDEAFLAYLLADHTAQEQTLLSGCKVVED